MSVARRVLGGRPEMIRNVVGAVVRGDDLFGRERTIELLWEKLDAGSVLLAAPRRFGKTSVMLRLFDAPRPGWAVAFLDVEDITTPTDLVTELAVTIARHPQMTARLAQLRAWPARLVGSLRRNVDEVAVFDAKLKLREAVERSWQDRGEELMNALGSCRDRSLIILDEFPVMLDRMARSEDGARDAAVLLRWLRRLRQTGPLVLRFLIGGSIGISHTLQRLGEPTALNDLERLTIEPFSPATADQFLEVLGASAGMDLSAGLRQRMLQMAGTPVPYFIQILFSEVRSACLASGAEPDEVLIEDAYRQRVLGNQCKSYFDSYYLRLGQYYTAEEEAAAKRILRRLAGSGSASRDDCRAAYAAALGDEASDEGFEALMARLEDDFYVRWNEQDGTYEFVCKILRDWWLRYHGLENGGLRR